MNRIVDYDYFEEVLNKLKLEVGGHINMKLHFVNFVYDSTEPKFEPVANLDILPENKNKINELFDLFYKEENLRGENGIIKFNWSYSLGVAIPEDKNAVYQKIIEDYLT